jgi:hypothetical protein
MYLSSEDATGAARTEREDNKEQQISDAGFKNYSLAMLAAPDKIVRTLHTAACENFFQISL